MTRKTASLVVAAVVLTALMAVAFFVPLPYVVLAPGVTENTLGTFDGKEVISIDGHRTYPTTGHLNLTTVSVTSPDFKPRLSSILDAWFSDDEIVLPRDVVYPPEKNSEQVEQENKTEMLDSQSTAIGVGLEQAGFDAIKIEVADTLAGSPADGVLEKDDLITSVDGTPVDVSADAIAAIGSLPPGSHVSIGIDRAGSPMTVRMVTAEDPDDPEKSKIGVYLHEDFDPPFDVSIDLGQEIGGPSAGTMFSLAIYDKLTPGDLTGGAFVAGTGTISTDGTVGQIGGVQQKIAGAYDAGATVFLVPAGDCAEAAGSDLADDIALVKIATVDDAIAALNSVASGDLADVERCTS